MQSVTSLARAAEFADPSPELVLIAALIVAHSRGRPKRVQRITAEMLAFAETHRQMGGIMRLRGAEYDARVIASMAQAAAWLERIEPFLLMMASR